MTPDPATAAGGRRDSEPAELYTASELAVIARTGDPEFVAELHRLKGMLRCRMREYQCDPIPILEAARVLMAPGGVYELRVPKAGRDGTISGYFDTPEKLAAAAAGLDGLYPSIYVTLNPVEPALLARAANRLRKHAELTTSDLQVARRRWVLIDCDPVRPAGISSSEAEHGLAIETARRIWRELRKTGFPDPVVADSGNGCHLLYRVDLPNNEAATARVKRLLAGLAARFSTPEVSIDQTVFNAARIVKLYGTKVRKGDSTPDRPHRRARLLHVPDRIEVFQL
jgi:hypothetical protein